MAPALLGDDCRGLLTDLCRALRARQIRAGGEDAGALHDSACGARHTRAAEAVLPFAVLARDTSATGGDNAGWVEAARALAAWLILRQQADGSWAEAPDNPWRGTTADQLLSLALALPILESSLSKAERRSWRMAIRGAADFLAGWMSEETGHINYCATAAAALAAAHAITRDAPHAEAARRLARLVALERIDDGGFVIGEGHRAGGRCYGTDPGYSVDMSLWSVGLAARLLGEPEVETAALRGIATHLDLVYPDGSFDGSWGTRANKWTGYGSKTAHGAQIGFGLFADRDPRAGAAAARNLAYLRGMVQDGLVGCGPFWWEHEKDVCLYPTVTRACNLALAILFAPQAPADAALPADAPFARLHRLTLTAIVRTTGLMATVSAYGYVVPGDRARSKYMARPTGGGLTNLWFDGWGWLQIGTPPLWRRWEPMHFPEAGPLTPLTPRIEEENGAAASHHEFGASLTLEDGSAPVVKVSGRLRTAAGGAGRLRYDWTHKFHAAGVEKEVLLRAGWRGATPRIVEPLVHRPGMSLTLQDPRTLDIAADAAAFRLSLLEGEGRIVPGTPAEDLWWPFPAVQGVVAAIETPRIPACERRRLRWILERVR